ncbi:ARM repeat-containing protein, partial [Gonapodya prolifera JEL478]
PQSAAKRLSPTPQTPLASLPSTAQRQLLSLFDRYQRERLLFAQSLAELAAREGTADALAAAGATRLLRPLMTDAVPAVQQAAAMAVGRMASWSEEVAGEVVREGIVEGLVGGLVDGNRFHKKACAFVLRSIAKHSPAHARSVADGGALPALARCIEDFDPQVKEGAVWAVGYVARQNSDLAQRVVSASLLPLLVLCLQEPSSPLKRVAASALSDISKHTPPLAHAVLDALAVRHLAPLTTHADAKLRRQAFSVLGQIAKHGIDMAESVVDGQGAGDDGAVVVEAVVRGVRDEDAAVRRAAATLVCEVVKHSEELSQLFVNSGALAPLVDYVTSTTGVSRLPGIMALGYISAFGEALALAVAVTGGVDAVARAMDTDEEDLVKSACAWTLGQVGRHSPEHARAVAASGALLRLADITCLPTNPSHPCTPPISPPKPTARSSSCLPRRRDWFIWTRS